MKASMRIKYMLTALWDLICGIGGFIFKVGVPTVAVLFFIYMFNYLPWWVCVLIALGAFLAIYLWIRADIQYKEDHETSCSVLHDKYYEITRIWFNMMNEGKSCRTIYGLMTAMIDEYDMLLEYHKKLYGEDDTYKVYCDRVDKFIKSCEENEKNELARQETLAKEMKELGGNGEVIERGILI